jgi:hypothetical protein
MKTVVRYLAENSTNPFASYKITAISIFLVFFIFVHFAPSTEFATVGRSCQARDDTLFLHGQGRFLQG